jgi:hypothetical protein
MLNSLAACLVEANWCKRIREYKFRDIRLKFS